MVNNANEILFRASSMGDIMSGVKKGWSVEDSLTCKKKLVQIYREHKYNRSPKIENKYTKKGNMAEEDAITLYSRVKKIKFTKNTERVNNKYFTGECDLFTGKTALKAEHTIDTKCSWDLSTFPSEYDNTSDTYEYQGEVYMDLFVATKHTIAYCLVNTPSRIISDLKYALKRKHEIIDLETEDYIKDCQELEKNHIFDMELFLIQNIGFELHTNLKEWSHNIPMDERVFEITREGNEITLNKMKARIDECRDWMNKNLFKNKK